MEQEFIIEGMTCDNCKKKVTASLVSLEGVTHVVVDRKSGLTQLQADRIVTKAELEKALGAKYAIVSRASILGYGSYHYRYKSIVLRIKPLAYIHELRWHHTPLVIAIV